MSDATVLGMRARAMSVTVGAWDGPGIRRELAALGTWSGARPPAPSIASPSTSDSGFRLASWRELLDAGVMQEGEPHLAATARPVAAVLSASALARLGSPASVTVTGPLGSVTLPAEVGDVLDNVIFVPMNAVGCSIYTDLGAGIGAEVAVAAGGAA